MSRVEGVSVAVGRGQVRVVEGVVGEFGKGVVVVVEGGSVVEVVIVSIRKHELQSVVGVVVFSGVEASLGVWCKNWTASRGQMSVVGHDSESSLAACQTACARSALEDCSDRGHALAYVLPHTPLPVQRVQGLL